MAAPKQTPRARECDHCRVEEGQPHSPTCAIAKKRGLPMKPLERRPLFPGAVVQFSAGKDWWAAIVTQVVPDVVMRVMHPVEPLEDEVVIAPIADQWRWGPA